MKHKYFLAAAILVFASLTVSHAELLSLHRFEDATSTVGDTILDSSANNNHGTVTTAAINLVASKSGFGNAADFAGSGGKVQALLAGAGTSVNDFTIAFWMKSSGLTGSDKYLMTRQQSGSGQLSVIYEYVDNQVELFDNQSPDTRSGSQINIADTNWHHVIYTRTGTDYDLYIDGVKSNIGTLTGAISCSEQLHIGSTASGAGTFEGQLDDVAWFDEGLTQAQVTSIMNGDFSAFGVIPPSDPTLAVPPSIHLGSVSPSPASSSQSFTVTNNGASNLLNITGLTFTGPNASAFTQGALPTGIATGGGTGSVNFTFNSGGVVGTYTATAEITSNDQNSPHSAIITIVVRDSATLYFSCAADNDLFQVMTAGGATHVRVDSPTTAINLADDGSSVLILADGYPTTKTPITQSDYTLASSKNLRLFVEFPATLPGMTVGAIRDTDLERAVVADSSFGAEFPLHRILVIHDCHFVDTTVSGAHLVSSKVAGYDHAVFGFSGTTTAPLLFEHSNGKILVSTTKLSQFVTARYAPKEGVQTIWKWTLNWLGANTETASLDWTPTVRPYFKENEPLPADAQRQAIIRGMDWHSNARLIIDPSWEHLYDSSPLIAPLPDPSLPAGKGKAGILEGFTSEISFDGTQPARWWRRNDSNGESAIAFALRWQIDGNQASKETAANLLDWLYDIDDGDPATSTSGLLRNTPADGDYGHTLWAAGHADSGRNSDSLYGDNCARIIFGCLGTAGVLNDSRWDEFLIRNIVANYRTTGFNGYRRNAIAASALRSGGWQTHWNSSYINYAPHYQSMIWASYLWLYDKTGYEPMLTRTRKAIRKMMLNYPNNWKWTNGIQQERAKMILPLAWLIRVDDQPEHRAWLKQIADDMLEDQLPSGAIREELGPDGNGSYPPPSSNAAYGTTEAAAIQENGDPMADMLYTCNFACIGLREAYAATGEPQYLQMENKMAEFFIRIQVRSENHPTLDGAWFRAFDYEKWDFFGSNADHGWGAWATEVGWTQGWISTFLAMRELDTNLWDISANSQIATHWEATRAEMLTEPDPYILPGQQSIPHAAVNKTVTLAVQPNASYPGDGASTLTDSLTSTTDHANSAWLGFLGDNLDATIDLGESIYLRSLQGVFLQNQAIGIHLPSNVTFSVSHDGITYQNVGQLTPPSSATNPSSHTVTTPDFNLMARYIRVSGVNTGSNNWLFADEILAHANSTAFTGDPLADVDGNGIPDLTDHALADSRMPEIALDSIHTTFEFMRNPWADDVDFVVEISTDLINWKDASPTFSLLTPGDLENGSQRMTYRADNTELPDTRYFLRLSIIHTP